MEYVETYAMSLKQRAYPARPGEFRKSNILIRSRFTAGLLENKLLSISLASVQDGDDGRLRAVLSKAEIKRLIGDNSHAFYDNLKTAAFRLLKSIIMTEDPASKKFRASILVTDVEYSEGDSYLGIVFNETFRSQILDISTNFTNLYLPTMCRFDRNGTHRLYETLRSYAYYPKDYTGPRDGRFPAVTYRISELRCLLNLVDISHDEFSKFFEGKASPDYDKVVEFAENLYKSDIEKGVPKKDRYPAPKYGTWRELKREIIEPAIAEMSEKTELEVTYDTITEGKSHKVVGIMFYIYDRGYEEEPANAGADIQKESRKPGLADLDGIDEEMQEEFTLKDIKCFYEDADGDIEKINKAYIVYKAAKDVDNPVGYIRSAIRGNYPVNDKKSRKTKREESTKRRMEEQYGMSYEELEKSLLKR